MARNDNGQKSKEMVIAKIPPIVLTETHNLTFFPDLQIFRSHSKLLLVMS